jgi:hypothetical protein
MAVRTAIALGYAVKDDLVIDTAEAHRVALAQASLAPWSWGSWGTLAGSAPYLVYPPPLFGRVDDPFFGFEPPLVSFPPWWRSSNPDQLGRGLVNGPGPSPGPAAVPTSLSATIGDQGRSIMGGQPQRSGSQGPIKGKLQLTVDMAGQVFLSGVVASEEDRRVIEGEARSVPGVSRVISDLRVQSRASDTPPPPPQPVLRVEPETRPANPRAESPAPPARPRNGPSIDVSMARDTQTLTRRVAEALSRRPLLKGLPIAVQSHGGVVTLSGKVPSAFEAMLAYRTVEQTPGVRDVLDHLEFQVPDENHPNPLKQKGRPEDVEPYLTSQLRRHLGDLAHVDRVRIRGDNVEIRGSLLHAEDRNRVQAILRSIPLLRDFRLDAVFDTE